MFSIPTPETLILPDQIQFAYRTFVAHNVCMYRFNLALSDHHAALLERLTASTHADSQTATIRRALEVYGAVIESGGAIMVECADGTVRELLVPEVG